MTGIVTSTAWIFVSHASADLANVRRVRNYMEEKGASPLLFHLMALAEPEEFWPIIEREIQARSFFLYCESEAAEVSSWVQKERDAVERARSTKAKRIGRMRVDQLELDKLSIDRFLSKLRVYPSFSHADRDAVIPFLTVLESFGFQVFRQEKALGPSDNIWTILSNEISLAAADGWLVLFMSERSMHSDWVLQELKAVQAMGGDIVIVALQHVDIAPRLAGFNVVNAFSNPEIAPTKLANLLLHL